MCVCVCVCVCVYACAHAVRACVCVCVRHCLAFYSGIVNYMLDEKASSTGSAIIKLTEENFDRIVNSADLILVDFYLKE